MTIEPDRKDWTWVLERSCPDCHYDADAVDVHALPELLLESTRAWAEVLARPDVAVRPAPHIWSALEYACHVRDVHRVFEERVRRMVEEDGPEFANWDQDEAAVAGRYAEQEPAAVGEELAEAAGRAAGRYAAVQLDEWERPGLRSNGSTFTVATLGRYHLHDVVHHLYDVGGV